MTVANLMRDMLEFDWFPYVDRDAHEAIEAFHARHSNLLGKEVLLQVKEVFSSYLGEYVGERFSQKQQRDMHQTYSLQVNASISIETESHSQQMWSPIHFFRILM